MQDLTSRLRELTKEPSRDTAADPKRLERVEKTRVEMAVQGKAILNTLASQAEALENSFRDIESRKIDRIVIAGCGDSWFAGAGVRFAIELMTGVTVDAVQALDFAAYGATACTSRTLVIGISSGGNTPAVMQALNAASQKGAFTVGISNTVGSPILTQFDAAFVVQADRKGWPTQSTNATMALLIALGAEIGKGRAVAATVMSELRALAGSLDDLCESLEPEVTALAEKWSSAGLVLYTGLGPNFAAAAIGAAKLRELSPSHAFAFPLEEYHHYRTQKAGDPLVLVATDPESQDRALDTALVAEEVGGPVFAILADDNPELESRVETVIKLPKVHPALNAMVSIIPLHLLAYHFAKSRSARGLGAPSLSSVA
ncbi:SIS domain-containing protein [Agrobacterium pusense]|uniref:SIS domain-containing protein n=2 Tax=Agrobacterium pusense TaxID=648995 RepID=UPI0032DBAB36